MPLVAPLSSLSSRLASHTVCDPHSFVRAVPFPVVLWAPSGGTLRSSFLVGLPIQGLLAYENYARGLSTSLSSALWVLSGLLSLFHLLGLPLSAASLFLHLVALSSPGSTNSCFYLFLLLGVFPSRWSPLYCFFLPSLWLFLSRGLVSSLPLSPVFELPWALVGLF